MRDRLRLVTDFATLKASQMVVIKPCGGCGGEHRGMLFGPADESAPGPNGKEIVESAFRVRPLSRCGLILVGAGTVAARVVYLVDTGMDSGAKTKRKEKARSR